MIKYVCGFLFDKEDNSQVVLVEKLKPEWFRGMWNGVGGKIKDDSESPEQAMKREFLEETGVEILGWELTLILLVEDFFSQVYFFRAFGDVKQVKTMEKERIGIMDWKKWLHKPEGFKVVPNLGWIIPFQFSDLAFPVSAKEYYRGGILGLSEKMRMKEAEFFRDEHS